MWTTRTALAVAAMLLSCSCAASSFDSAAEASLLLQRDAEWAKAATEGKDVERIVSYWSDDAVVIPQGQPAFEGKPAIRSFVQQCLSIPGFKIHWTSEKVSFSPDGKLAYMHGSSMTTATGPNGTTVSVPGRGLSIWRREEDGQWRCVLDIWNDPPADASAAR